MFKLHLFGGLALFLIILTPIINTLVETVLTNLNLNFRVSYSNSARSLFLKCTVVDFINYTVRQRLKNCLSKFFD